MSHSELEIEGWHSRLRMFRFRAVTEPNGGDMLEARVPFDGEAELVAFFERAGRPLTLLPPDARQPVVGAEYTIAEYEELRHPLADFPAYENVGRTKLFGVSVYVRITAREIFLCLSGATGDPYEVTEGDVANALTIEDGLQLKN